MPPKVKSALDIIVSGLLLVLVFYLVAKEPTPELPMSSIGGLVMSYLGLLFICSYLAPKRLYLFRMLSFASEHLSYPRRREMALVYGVVFFAIAAFYGVKIINAG